MYMYINIYIYIYIYMCAWDVEIGSPSHQSTLDAVVSWSEFPIVPSYPHYPHPRGAGFRLVQGALLRMVGSEIGYLGKGVVRAGGG